jgi:hypothetical protein
MTFKLTYDYNECIINILNMNFKNKIQGEGVLIQLHPPLKFKGIPCKGNVDSYYGLFVYLLLIFSFFLIRD